MTDKKDILFFTENDLYMIKLHSRKDGYSQCLYRIVTSAMYELNETSTIKIFLRILHAFHYYMDELNENEMNMVINDLEILANKLKVPEDIKKTRMIKLMNNNREKNDKQQNNE